MSHPVLQSRKRAEGVEVGKWGVELQLHTPHFVAYSSMGKVALPTARAESRFPRLFHGSYWFDL